MILSVVAFRLSVQKGIHDSLWFPSDSLYRRAYMIVSPCGGKNPVCMLRFNMHEIMMIRDIKMYHVTRGQVMYDIDKASHDMMSIPLVTECFRLQVIYSPNPTLTTP